MATQARAMDEPRSRLSRERVLEAAIELADGGGIGSLTMRRLAQELRVEAMTLYYYVANKDDLLDGLVDIVTGEIELPAPGGDWKAEIRRTALSAYDIYVRHPWAAGLSLAVKTVGPSRLRYMNAILGAFRAAGFSAGLTDHAYHAIESHIMGFTLWEVGMNLGTREDMEKLTTTFLERLSENEFPHLAEHVRQHMEPRRPDDLPEFEFGLTLILDGLERLRDAA